jgi:hypothetical protein
MGKLTQINETINETHMVCFLLHLGFLHKCVNKSYIKLPRYYPTEGKRMGEQTTLTLATTGRDSLRTTVPMSIIRHFRLRPGDKLDWNFEVNNGEIVILVRPEKNSSGNAPIRIREQPQVQATRGKYKS